MRVSREEEQIAFYCVVSYLYILKIPPQVELPQRDAYESIY